MIFHQTAILIALFYCIAAFGVAYEVIFEGIQNPETLKLVQSASQLEKLKDCPPATFIGLKRRAEGDLSNIIKALHSLALYDAKVDFHIENDRSQVILQIQEGPVYPLATFTIHYSQNGAEISADVLACPITLEDLKVEIGSPALPEMILSAEDILLDRLNLQGYAFASIKKRDVFADKKAQSVIVCLVVDIGPLTYFGPTQIKGLEQVHGNFFFKKLRWQAGELYHPKKIEKTQEALELSGLFQSVNITQAENPVEGNLLPLEISVLEGKQRSIGFGLNYTTALGFGLAAEWENRNLLGEGQKLSTRADLWQKLQEGNIRYLIPDFGRQEQNLIWLLEYHHERNKSFTESTFSFSGTIERKINDHWRISYGGMYKLLHTQRSAHNGRFDLIKVPMQLFWTNTDSILEPTKGASLQLKTVPSVQILSPQFFYAINTLTGTIYQSITPNNRHIFAAKLMLGSIVGTSEFEVPPPERFYAGSENTLRGYHYLTVSPLSCKDKPIGGRSLFIYSLELRNRIGKNFGLVFFYEMGNVYKEFYPNPHKRLLQSTGLGLRYYTPVGPIRLGLAIPLNKTV